MDYGQNEPFNITNPGTDEGNLHGGKIVPGGGTAKVNQSKTLGIPGIEDIWVELYNGKTYSYRICVNGHRVEDKDHIKLVFTDQSTSADTYTVRIRSTTTKDHHIRFNSTNPTIKLVEWSR